MNLVTEQKQELIKKFEDHDGDTGSCAVQIALLTQRIEKLNEHFAIHKKDHSSRHGLLKMVGHRRKLLNYLKLTDREGYQKLIGDLGLRK